MYFNIKVLGNSLYLSLSNIPKNNSVSWHDQTTENKKEVQCAQKGGGGMLVFVICGFIKNFIPNPYFIFQIFHEKSFKIRHVMFLYFNFSVRYS